MKTSDGSFTNSKGELVFVSIDRFVNDVTAGDKCFLCAQPIVEGCVTKEHIIPNWILRKCNLHDRLITLPNGASSNTVNMYYLAAKIATDCLIESLKNQSRVLLKMDLVASNLFYTVEVNRLYLFGCLCYLLKHT